MVNLFGNRIKGQPTAIAHVVVVIVMRIKRFVVIVAIRFDAAALNTLLLKRTFPTFISSLHLFLRCLFT